MTLYVSLATLQFIQGPGNSSPIGALSFKFGTGGPINLIFLDNNDTVPVQLPNQATQLIEFGIKAKGDYDNTDFLVYSSAWTVPAGAGTTYVGAPSFNTSELEALFNADQDSIATILEIAWRDTSIGGSFPTRIFTENVIIYNNIIKGDEGSPTPATPTYYTAAATDTLLAAKVTGTLDTDGTLAADSDTHIPSQKAVKTYVDAHSGGSSAWVKKVANYAAVAGDKIIDGAGALAFTLPAATGSGAEINFADGLGTWASSSSTVTPNGTDNINGTNAAATLNVNWGTLRLVDVSAGNWQAA